MSEAELIVEPARLAAFEDQWDALSVQCAEPISGPAWMLAWWRHVAPPKAQLRVAVVRDGEALIGIVPLYLDTSEPRRLRPLADDFSSSVSPLARADRIWEVASATAELLQRSQPQMRILSLSPLLAGSPWLSAMRETWPGRARPLLLRYAVRDAPTISLGHDSIEDWLGRRSASFRANVRKRRRQFEAAGGVARISSEETLASDIDAFIDLHAGRWESRQTQSRLATLGERLSPLLHALAERLIGSGRFRLLLLEIDEQPIGALLAIAAGGEVVGINSGWDERFKQFSPARLALLYMLEDAIARRERRYSLGWGSLSYKLDFADGNDPVAECALLPSNPRLLTTLLTSDVLVRQLRRSVRGALTDEEVRRARQLLDARKVGLLSRSTAENGLDR